MTSYFFEIIYWNLVSPLINCIFDASIGISKNWEGLEMLRKENMF